MHKFRTGEFQISPIMKVEVARETEKSVYVVNRGGCERRENKRGEFQNYFDTWAEAHQFLVVRALAKFNSAQETLKAYEAQLNEIKNLKQVDAQ